MNVQDRSNVVFMSGTLSTPGTLIRHLCRSRVYEKGSSFTKSAWFLLLASILALFSGFMLGVNLFDYRTAYFIHTVVAPLLFVALLYLHSVAAIIFVSKRVRRLDNEGFKDNGKFCMDSDFHGVHRPVSSPDNAGFFNCSGPSTTDNRSGNHSDDFISEYRRSHRFNNHSDTHQLCTASTTFNRTNKADNSPEIPRRPNFKNQVGEKRFIRS
jgi:hypothetical protein